MPAWGSRCWDAGAGVQWRGCSLDPQPPPSDTCSALWPGQEDGQPGVSGPTTILLGWLWGPSPRPSASLMAEQPQGSWGPGAVGCPGMGDKKECGLENGSWQGCSWRCWRWHGGMGGPCWGSQSPVRGWGRDKMGREHRMPVQCPSDP